MLVYFIHEFLFQNNYIFNVLESEEQCYTIILYIYIATNLLLYCSKRNGKRILNIENNDLFNNVLVIWKG